MVWVSYPPPTVHVLIIANPVSGQGRARRHGAALADVLAGRGHAPNCVASQPICATQWLPRHLESADAVVVVGGDGTVRSVAQVVAQSGVPLVHAPQGNENLFARSLGMGPHLEDSVRLIESGTRRVIDVGVAGGHAMLLMASIGLDAEIVADVAAHRRASVSNWHYLTACARTLPGWRPAEVTVQVDGELVVPPQRGWAVVSNAAMYGGAINPAPMARMDDGLLDMTFFRASSALEMLAWLVRCRLGRQLGAPGFVHRRVREQVVITPAEPVRWQLDGDPPPDAALTGHLEVAIGERPLTVLMPPDCGQPPTPSVILGG